MTICKDCYIPMASIMSFSKDRHEKFCRCPKCYGETKHRRLNEGESPFGEILDKTIHYRK